jgi:hypothetical protein
VSTTKFVVKKKRIMGQRLIVNQEEKETIQKLYENMAGVAFGGEMNAFKNVDFYYDDVTKSFEVVVRDGGKVIRYTASIKK